MVFWTSSFIRDRPFNLKGGGVYGFLIRSEKKFRTTQELEYLFFCRAKCEIFFQNLTLGYMTKTLNHIIVFFLHQNQNIFFSNIGNQNIFLEENHKLLSFTFKFGKHNIFSKFRICVGKFQIEDTKRGKGLYDIFLQNNMFIPVWFQIRFWNFSIRKNWL